MKKLNLFICFICFLSCKESKGTILDNTIKEELIVRITFKTNVEDVFKVRMDNIEVDEFQKKNIVIRERIPVTSDYEKIECNFGLGNFSNHIHFNLGSKVKSIIIRTIEVSYKESILIITQENFNEFLRVNKFVEFEKENFKIITKEIENKHNPEISIKYSAIEFLKKLQAIN